MKTRIERLRYIYDELHRLSEDPIDIFQNHSIIAIASEVRKALEREKLPFAKRTREYIQQNTYSFMDVRPFNTVLDRKGKWEARTVEDRVARVASFNEEDSLELIHLQPDTEASTIPKVVS